MLSAKEIKELTGMKTKNEGLNKIANQISKRKWKDDFIYGGMDFRKQIVYFSKVSKINNDSGVCIERIKLGMMEVFDCISGKLINQQKGV